MTLEEMEHDENIEKKNMEVVDFVKESIHKITYCEKKCIVLQ